MSFLRRINRPRTLRTVRLTLERLESLIVPAPLPPTNLTAIGVSANSITLDWDASTDPTVTGYNVIAKVWVNGTHSPRGSGGTPGHYNYNTIASSVPTNSDTISGLTAGSTHTYIVTAISPTGTSPYSQAASAETWVAPSTPYSTEFELSSGAVWSGAVDVQAGSAVQVKLLIAGNPLNYSIASGPSTVSVDQHGVITYTPAASEVGLNTITITASNALGSVQQQIQFNVTATDPSLLTPTVTVDSATDTYNAYSQPITATAVGSDGVTPVSGSMTITYNGFTGAPINAGTYNVLATFTSSDPNYGPAYASGTLTINKATPAFGGLSDQTFTVGQSTTTVSGNVSASGAVPNAEYVVVALNGQVADATVGTGGAFSATFTTSSLAVGSYTVDYYYAGDANLTAAPTATSNITVIPTVPPQVTLNPVNHTIEAPDPVSFTAAATGSPNPSCQWQVSTDGGVTFTNITGATSTTYTIGTYGGLNGNYYRAVFSNGVDAPAITTAAKLTVQYAPIITTEPADTSVVLGQSATFTAAVSANPHASVQWQESVNGGAFVNITGATNLSFTFTPTAADNGDQFQAVFTNDVDTVTTSAATLSIVAPTTVASVQVNDGTAQRSQVRSIAVTFSGPVTFANNNVAAAFTLTHLTDNNAVLLAATTSTDSQGRTVVTLTFSGGETDPNSGANPSLADGRYSLGIAAASVFGATGAMIDGAGNGTPGSNYVSPPDNADGTGLHLFRLYGDIDGNGTVNAYDFSQFRLAFGSASTDPAYAAAFDIDGNGAINAFDFAQFRLRYGSSV